MSNYILKITNTSGEEGSIIPDVEFSYTDNLNMVNQANIKISGSSSSKRSLIEMGSIVKIYRGGTLEFKGLVDSVDYLGGGGMSIKSSGWEIWLAKENGDYAGSPWTATASATIFTAILGEASQPAGDTWSAGTIEAGTSMDFRLAVTESLYNSISNLKEKTTQDIGIDYINQEIDVLDHKGSSTSVATFNSNIQMNNLRVTQTYPIGNDVRVYGKGEGETRILSNVANGQDATSKSTYGTIRKIVRDPSIVTQAEANLLADSLVAIYKDPVKIYDFNVINPNQSIVAGDVITLNAKSQGLSNEEVRIVGVTKGFQGEREFLNYQVTNKAYSKLINKKDEVLAAIDKNNRDNQTYDLYQEEYSNQTLDTCIGGNSCFTCSFVDLIGLGILGTDICTCSGDWMYFNANISAPAHVIQAGTLNINASSAFNCINDTLNVSGALTIGAYTLPNTDGGAGEVLCTNGSGTLAWGTGAGSAFWEDAADPYIAPISACGLCLDGDIKDADSTHSLGTNESPGQFKEVYAACGFFSTCVHTPVIDSSGIISICNSAGKVAEFGATCACFGAMRTKNINAFSNGGCSVGATACRFAEGYMNCIYACRKLTVPVGTNCY